MGDEAKSKKKLEVKERQRKSKTRFHLENVAYLVVGVIVVFYGIYLYDREMFHSYSEKSAVLQPFTVFFDLVEKYSPFHEFLEPDPKAPAEGKKDPVFTVEQLKLYDGSEGSPGLYLAITGKVFDVSKGKDHYGPGGGYSFFSAKDGTRAFVTGEFNDAGLTDDIEGLSNQDYLGIAEWIDFYTQDYTYVGKVVGRYYDENGLETAYWKEAQNWFRDAEADRDQKNEEKRLYPTCNTEWNRETGQRVWCTSKTTGVERGWVGVPRRLFLPGRAERCACIRNKGPPSNDPGASSDEGDLKSPHIKEYEGCDPEATSCIVVKKAEETEG